MPIQFKTPLVWVGSKNKYIKKFIRFIPSDIKAGAFGATYYEPFCGSGALYFFLRSLGLIDNGFLSDKNYSLIGFYRGLKLNPRVVYYHYDQHVKRHSLKYFKRVLTEHPKDSLEMLAGRFLYINRASYGGMYRENSNFEMNMYCRKQVLPIEGSQLILASHFLDGTTTQTLDYTYTLDKVRKNDFVFLDPPYAEFNPSDMLSTYGHGTFDQIALYNYCRKLNDLGVRFMMTNSNTDSLKELYADFNIQYYTATYKLGKDQKTAKRAYEMVITNY